MSHSFIKDSVFEHDLLSVTHGDTTPAAVALGALVVGAYDSNPNTASKKCFLDGRPFPGIFTNLDAGGAQFWRDGSVVPFVIGGASSATSWRKLPQGTPGQVLAVGAAGVEWSSSVAGVGVGLSGRVYRASDQSFSSAVDNTVSFSTADWDDGGYWSAAAPTKLIAPASGVYSIVGCISYPNASFGLAWQRIFVNGVLKAEDAGGLNNVSAAYGAYDTHQIAAILKLTAGDYVELHCLPVRFSGALEGCKGGQNYTWLSIVRVG